MSRSAGLLLVVVVHGCGDPIDAGLPEVPATTTGTPPETTSEGPTTGDESGTTGAVDVCAPTVETIPEEAFVASFIDAICGQKDACGCADTLCTGKFKADLEMLVAYAGEQGMVYDPGCAALAVQTYVTSRGCLNGEAANYPFCVDCPVYRGDTAEGAACSVPLVPAVYLFSEPCAGPGGLCLDDVCVVPPEAPLKPGEVCDADDTTILASCVAGMTCDFFDSKRCEPELAVGEFCDVQQGVCGGFTLCGDDGVCEPYRPPGAACTSDYDCASEWCKDSVCTEYVWVCDVEGVEDLIGKVH